jgi:hypothetical protein
MRYRVPPIIPFVLIVTLLGTITKCGPGNSDNYSTIGEDFVPETIVPVPESDSLTLRFDPDSIQQVPDPILKFIIEKYSKEYGYVDTVNIENEMRFLVEGDLVLSRQGFIDHFIFREAERQSVQVEERKIIVRVYRHKKLLLDNPASVTYAIKKSGFPSEAFYRRVKSSLEAAANEWNNASGVNFVHLEEWDGKLTDNQYPGELFFIVKYGYSDKDFVASSFFPHFKLPKDRIILINDYYMTTKYDSIGVFRHELGHAMGFLHEHLRAGVTAQCPDEPSARFFSVGDYDPTSVMHYYCRTVGFGSYELKLSPIDVAGAAALYHKPTP